MAFFRQYVTPFLILLVFLVALAAVTARIFLPADMAAPAPVEEVSFADTLQLESIFPTNFQANS